MKNVPARRPLEASARRSSGRAKFVFYALLAIACLVVSRFFVVQGREGPMLAARGYEQRLTTVNLAAHRGSIFDRGGVTLVRSLPSQSVYATTGEIADARGEARTLQPILRDLTVRDLADSLRARMPYIQVDHKITREQSNAIAKLALPGISIVPETTGVRFDPSGRLASTVIGFTGFNENGLAGIEYAFDDLLRGTPGKMELEGDEFGRAIPFAQPHVVIAAKPGHSLVLTLDSYLQSETERVLRETVAKWHAASGNAIVMDPWTGEVLALANAPDYDVPRYDRYTADDRRDRAIEDAYEPGSVFKLITAAAALDSGKVTPEDRFPARDRLPIGGYTIFNAEDGFLAGSGSTENLEEIIAKSHNVGAAEVGMRIGARTMADALDRFGFGRPTEVGLPGESPGIVPPLATWSETTLPTIAFGQGISTTPMAIARAYAAIANGGLLMRPRIVSEILDGDGTVAYRYAPEIERRVMTAKTAAVLRGYLRAVVVRGTGNPTARVPGYTTAGKTGTAQIAENGHYSAGAYVASFVGLVPAEEPKYVILVKIERPHGAIYGGVVAAPAFAEIARLAMMRAGVLPAGPRLVRLDSVAKRRL
ncbi:MAG: penicillin-binding protein 2 [Candidatus Eremiobacteraeota bacterium]|nr:penicillin-binding protein 2 [Candidatus Eremiobacteraeota bacterium]